MDQSERMIATGNDKSLGPTTKLPQKYKKITRDGRWEEMFQRLVAFRKKHGHCIVPNRYAEDRQLGTWVSTQRSDYKAYLNGKVRSLRMTPTRAKRLEEIGFDWSAKNKSSDIRWESSFIKLLEYVVENGHALVPIGWQGDIQLANWVSTQRQEYKANRKERKQKKGHTSSLSPKRTRLLDSIGFVWEAPLSGLGDLRKEIIKSKARKHIQKTAKRLLQDFKSASNSVSKSQQDQSEPHVTDFSQEAGNRKSLARKTDSPISRSKAEKRRKVPSNTLLKIDLPTTLPKIEAATVPSEGKAVVSSFLDPTMMMWQNSGLDRLPFNSAAGVSQLSMTMPLIPSYSNLQYISLAQQNFGLQLPSAPLGHIPSIMPWASLHHLEAQYALHNTAFANTLFQTSQRNQPILGDVLTFPQSLNVNQHQLHATASMIYDRERIAANTADDADKKKM